MVHNHYQQPGGEDQVVANEVDLLRQRGHTVTTFTAHNDAVTDLSPAQLAARTVWSHPAYRGLRSHLRQTPADLVHVHNTLPLLSPAVYYAARRAGCAVVQTLHNYRLVCPGALLYREGRACEDCVGRAVPWPGVLHGCYRKSRSATAGVASMLTTHRAAGTWNRSVDTYVALTPFARQIFIRGGLPEAKLLVKPNFVVEDPGEGTGSGGYALFVGRLTEEKGVRTLLEAWQPARSSHSPGSPALPLRIVGDGPLRPQVEAAAANHPGIEWLGQRPHDAVLELMRDAVALVFPSTWYEGLPMTVLEAFATGLPVVASDVGALSSLVQHAENGLLFRSGDAGDLASQVAWIQSHPAHWADVRRRARREYEARYTACRNYTLLMDTYRHALGTAKNDDFGKSYTSSRFETP